jgi:hypothetical protein
MFEQVCWVIIQQIIESIYTEQSDMYYVTTITLLPL